mmetsp:Transcript_13335/g.27080  ORF Transcript_13335/g.27080 Transcript_13335/m.27080 type:complete len:312 (-) Transcript_13335:367-1302(-)|eukprot:CAMPEP_0184679742 /NCGR_PEP_ID=MMETSP0312-20130426/2603_1 /TAXON_ID=31354 /ORGANISM="Compsopogon coeruleus, Strain SAG 36.94" /LENGTH=311 /DNA_ID=CAMNT_0027129389 /DNA_START=1326 /DNA_END=2261 /DNA_ORIENTATION=+
MTINSIDGQWECVRKNLGQFEGSLTLYDTEGAFLRREPTVLFAYGSGSVVDTVDRPFQLNFVLRRCEQERDGVQNLFRVTDYVARGRVFDSNGAMDSGPTGLTKGYPIFVEQNLNIWQDDQIRGRTRTVVRYSEEARLEGMTVIRERPRKAPQMFFELPPHPTIVDEEARSEDFLTTSSALNVSTFVGRWKVEGVILGRDGSESNAQGFRTSSLSSDGLLYHEINENEDRYDGRVLGNGNIAPSPSSESSEFTFFLGGGISIRTPLVFEPYPKSISELIWLTDNSTCMRIRREYRAMEWVRTHFLVEKKIQ